MKRLLTALLAFSMLVTGFMGAAAQSDPVVSSGLNEPASYVDDRGDVIATIQVTNVEENWEDYDEYSAPENGTVYRAITFEVTNVSGSATIIEPYDFSMLDATGRNNSAGYVSAAEGADTEIFSDDLPLPDGDSAELTMVFQTYDDVMPAAFVWQPDSGVIVMVQLDAGDVENPAMANGFNAPVTWTDDRGRAVATLEVTEIEDNWEDYDDYYAPDAGTAYRAVHFTITNVSQSATIIEPYSFSMLDSMGRNNSAGYVSAAEDSDTPLFEEDTPLPAGESLEGVMVFQTYDDVDAAAFIWQPDSGVLNIVNLAGESAPAGGDDSEATPASDDEDEVTASPAAVDTDSEDNDADTADNDEAEAGQSAADGEMVAIDGSPVTFVDTLGDEGGTITPIGIIDRWEGYPEGQEPTDGTRYVVVVFEIDVRGTQSQQVAPLDFTLVSDTDGEYPSDLYLNADDADVEIMEGGETLEQLELVEVAIPFLVPDGEMPSQVIWNNGVEDVVIDLGQ